jgi:hypothetical protein
VRRRQSRERGRRKILTGERDASHRQEGKGGKRRRGSDCARPINGMNDGKGGSVYVAGGLLCRNHTERKGGESGLCITWPSKRPGEGLNTGKMPTDSGDGRH